MGTLSGIFGFALALCLATQSSAQSLNSSLGALTVRQVADNLDSPWGLAHLPDGAFLVTEQGGDLFHFDAKGARVTVRGTPRVQEVGQGGLLDVMVPRDFAETREIFLSFARRQGSGEGTALARGVLSPDGGRLRDVEVIFEMERGSSGGRHFGSRIVEGRDGYLYMTIGDRGDRPSAQDLGRESGSVIRIARDGRIPRNNPFVGQSGAQPEIYSYGHRNPQGATLDRQGQLWVVEHGAKGGDEINRIEKGANFGWPVISYGRHYSGFKIGEGTHKAGMKQPAFFWDPSMAPSGMMIYGATSDGTMFPEWVGDFFVGSLKFDYLSRLEPSGGLREVEQIKSAITGRVRDVREAPDGAIWIISAGNGAVYRISR